MLPLQPQYIYGVSRWPGGLTSPWSPVVALGISLDFVLTSVKHTWGGVILFVLHFLIWPSLTTSVSKEE